MDIALRAVIDLVRYYGCISEELRTALVANAVAVEKPASQRIFAITECVRAKDDTFVYAPGMDQGWTSVKKGDLIGRYSDGSTVASPRDGMLIFQTSPDKIIPGRNLCVIAREI